MYYKKYLDFIIILLLVTIVIQNIYKKQQHLIISNTFSIIKSMRYDLSFNARNYITHLNIKYRDSYFKTGNIRDGDGNLDDMVPYPWASGSNLSLIQLLHILLAEDYPEEYIEIKNIYSKENDLIWNEIVALNWINGNTDTVDDNSLSEYIKYTHKKFIKFPVEEKDPVILAKLKEKARDLLYSDSYVESCFKISEQYKNIFKKVLDKIAADEHVQNIMYFLFILLVLVVQIFVNFLNK